MGDGDGRRVTTVQGDWTGLISFVSAVLLSTFILLFLLSSSVSLSNLYLAVPMRGCLGKKTLVMSSPFPIAILNGTCSLPALRLILFCGDVPTIKTKLNITPGYSMGLKSVCQPEPGLRRVTPLALVLPYPKTVG